MAFEGHKAESRLPLRKGHDLGRSSIQARWLLGRTSLASISGSWEMSALVLKQGSVQHIAASTTANLPGPIEDMERKVTHSSLDALTREEVWRKMVFLCNTFYLSKRIPMPLSVDDLAQVSYFFLEIYKAMLAQNPRRKRQCFMPVMQKINQGTSMKCPEVS